MKTQTIARLFLVMCCATYLVSNTAAAADSKSWENLATLQSGEKIVVIETNAKAERVGRFTHFDSDSISLRAGTAEMLIARSAVVRIYSRQRTKRVRNALIGVGIGAGIGLLADQTLGSYLRNESNPDNARALIWATPIAIGATLGGLIPGRGTIYKRN